jgi:hypothetical protein
LPTPDELPPLPDEPLFELPLEEDDDPLCVW